MKDGEKGTLRLKVGLADMLKGGVIMDVTTPEQAKIAEDAGACAVMALERVPADIRAAGGVARMADPTVVIKIKESVSIPVMAGSVRLIRRYTAVDMPVRATNDIRYAAMTSVNVCVPNARSHAVTVSVQKHWWNAYMKKLA